MPKELLHTDSLDDIISPMPIIPVPDQEAQNDPVYRGLEGLYNKEKWLASGLRVIMFTGMISLGLLMASQVFLRYVLELPFLGMEELAPMLALWIYFSGMAYCSRERDHIEGGLLSLLTQNPRTLMSVRLFGSLVCFLALIVYAYFGWKYASFNFGLGRKSVYMHWPKYLWDFSMVSGFILMILYMTLQIFLETRSLFLDKVGAK
ncbi:TRAP transporter small permease [Kiloniella sp.]|uniref:TRAP transporter small permease n=1 Tax=Kiloniella sp. TaxID=1938587 RepID=UPI003B01A8B8